MAETAKVTQRRSAPPSAPVSRSGSAPGSRPNVVRLSNAEREMANMMGMTDMEYAKNKQALQKEGKLQ
jgi:phage I-like protein